MSGTTGGTARRRTVRIGLGLLVVLFMGGAAAAWVLGTHGGARWAVGMLDRYGFEAEEVRGRVLGGLLIRGISYQAPGVEVRADEVILRWRPRTLARGILDVRLLEVRAPTVTLTGGDEPDPDTPPELPGLTSPVRVDLRSLRVTDLTVSRDDGEIIRLSEITASVAMDGGAIDLRSAAVRHEAFGVELSGALESRGDYPLNLAFDWRAEPAELPAMEGRGSLEGSVADLSIRHALSSPSLVILEAEVAGLPGTPSWSGRLRADRADVGPFLPDGPLEWASLDVEGSGIGPDAGFELALAAGGEELGELAGRIEGETDGRVVRLHALSLLGDLPAAAVSAEGGGELRIEDGGSGALSIDWSADVSEGPVLAGRTDASGTLARIDLTSRLVSPVAGDLNAVLTDPGDAPAWEAELGIPPFRLAELDPELPGHRVSLSASASGDLATFVARGDARGWLVAESGGESSGAADFVVRGNLEERRGTLDQLVVRPNAGGAARVRGEADFAGPELRFALDGDWEELGWTGANGGPSIRSAAGRFRAAGTPSLYSFSGDSEVEVDEELRAALRFEGGGTDAGAHLDSLLLDGEAIRASLGGRLSWDPVVAWEGEIEVEEARLDALGGPIPGRMEARVSGQGVFESDGLVASFQAPYLLYQDGDRRVEARGGGGISADTLRVDTLEVRAGQNRLWARGVLAENWDVSWELDAPDLTSGIGLESGSIVGGGRVSGARLRPHITAELEASRVSASAFALDSADVSLAVDLADRTPSRVRVLLAGLEADGRRVGASLSGEGRLERHQVSLAAWTADGDSVSLALDGTLTLPGGDEVPLRWEGSVARADAVSPSLGEWRLQDPARLEAGPDAVLLDTFCLVSGPADACLAGNWTREVGGEGALHLRGLLLQRFAELLPPGLEATGVASVAANAAFDAEGVRSGRLEAGIEEGRLRYVTATGTEETRDLELAELTTTLDSGGHLDGALRIRFVDGGGAEGEWEASPFPGGPESRISARFDAEMHDRGLLSALSEDLWDSEGVLRAAVLVDGTVGRPRVTGSVVIEDGALEVPRLGVRVTDIALTAGEMAPDEWSLEGGARSGRGALRITGTARLPRPDRPASLVAQVGGTDFQVMNNDLARVDASPALDIIAGPEGAAVTGSVTIPRAALTPGDMEGVAVVSPDVTIVGESEDDEPREIVPPNLRARVRIVMGDSVRVDGFGVTGRVTGAVTVVEEPDRLTTGQGELQLVDGAYTAARQRLTIERARLIYSDRQLEDPGLDIRLTRQTRDVLAGMEVRGTAQEPEITVVSDPQMPQSEAMAYLLIGRPVRGTGQQDSDLMERVATSMGLAGGAALLGRIGPALGLAEARIERGDSFSETALVVGSYFTPRLFVSYGIGLFGEATSTLRLRYELTERWSLRTESGRELGADLLYSVEQ